LHDAGCDIVQGYYFARSLPADEFERTILEAGKNRQDGTGEGGRR